MGNIYKGTELLAYGKDTVDALQKEYGELVYSSVPLNNDSYHLADGSLLTSSGDYADFVAYMGAKYTSGDTDCFTTEANWQATATLSTTGSCGKYVYDSVNGTLRIPKYNGILEASTSSSYLGDLTQAGLPTLFTQTAGAHTHAASTGTENAHTHTRGTMNISGSFQGGRSGSAVSGAFTKASGADAYTTGTADMYTITFTASRNWTGSTSAGTAHNHTATINSAGGHTHTLYWNPNNLQTTNTVQPETTKILVYIVVKRTAKSLALTNFDNITSDLNSKADKDLSNLSLSKSAKHELCTLSLPSDNYVSLTLGTSGASYSAPADGYFSAAYTGTVGSAYLQFNNLSTGMLSMASYVGGWGAAFIPVKLGDSVSVTYGGTNFSLQFFRFIYAEGETV